MKRILVAALGVSILGLSLAQKTAIEVKGGFQTPESILVDTKNDVYLVSNINGNPSEADNNGFISKVAPDGTILELKWLEGGVGGISLNAPKGMALVGNSLYITDLNVVRVFDKNSKRSLGTIKIPDSSFLNDLATDNMGNVYVSDSGLKPDFSPSGTAAVYKINRLREITAVAKGEALALPNGLSVANGELYVVPFGSKDVYTLGANGKQTNVVQLPGGSLDGIEWFNGAWYISSWETSSVYSIKNGVVSVVVDKIPSPADIGIDTKRGHLLIPVFNENRLVFQPL